MAVSALEKPGVNDVNFLARFYVLGIMFNFRGLNWTLKIEALPSISGNYFKSACQSVLVSNMCGMLVPAKIAASVVY